LFCWRLEHALLSVLHRVHAAFLQSSSVSQCEPQIVGVGSHSAVHTDPMKWQHVLVQSGLPLLSTLHAVHLDPALHAGGGVGGGVGAGVGGLVFAQVQGLVIVALQQSWNAASPHCPGDPAGTVQSQTIPVEQQYL
jgi:hypothetical protein